MATLLPPRTAALPLALAAACALCAGCHPRPEDAPETHAAGPVRQVDAGALPAAGAAAGEAPAPQVVPIRDWIRPAIPLIEPPEVISIWFFPRKSLDGLAYREGFWCHRVIRSFSWGRERAMVEGGVGLDGLPGGGRLRPTTGEESGLEAQPWFVDALASATAAPWVEVVRASAGQPATVPPTLAPGALPSGVGEKAGAGAGAGPGAGPPSGSPGGGR